jgi:hypothetical protein
MSGFVTGNPGSEPRSLHHSMDIKSTGVLAPLVRGSANSCRSPTVMGPVSAARAGAARVRKKATAATAQNFLMMAAPRKLDIVFLRAAAWVSKAAYCAFWKEPQRLRKRLVGTVKHKHGSGRVDLPERASTGFRILDRQRCYFPAPDTISAPRRQAVSSRTMILGLPLSLPGVVAALDLLTLPSVGEVRFPGPSRTRRAPRSLPSLAEGARDPPPQHARPRQREGGGYHWQFGTGLNTLAS